MNFTSSLPQLPALGPTEPMTDSAHFLVFFSAPFLTSQLPSGAEAGGSEGNDNSQCGDKSPLSWGSLELNPSSALVECVGERGNERAVPCTGVLSPSCGGTANGHGISAAWHTVNPG